jgi:lipopolysaccharide export system protein LptA
MWTPKRIVLLVGWFTFFVCVYVGSSYVLGGIDGLPPLPDRFKPIGVVGMDIDGPSFRGASEPRANKRLRQAFGEGSEELKSRKFKLEVEPRGLVLAAQEVVIDSEGRAVLKPFSVAVFSKDKSETKLETKYPDITTVQADVAYLRFDKPLKSITQIGGSKIVGGELKGNIRISNNRGTGERSDDVFLETPGTLFYDEQRHHVWTQDPVRIMDLRSKPRPTTIDGTGADLYLLAEAPKENAPAAKQKNQTVSGVDLVELRADVKMDLWIDSRSGLLGPARPDAKGSKAIVGQTSGAPGADKKVDAPAESSKVVIETQGPFIYDFKSDKALFNISKITGPRPNLVSVDRYDERTKMTDQLKCDLLEIQFSRKTGVAASNAGSATDKLEIESVRATGKQVVLSSDAEVLEAHGNEFSFNNKTSMSVLKGQPFMDAMKSGNHISAPELQMVNIKGKEKAEAIGAGTMSFRGTPGAKKLQEARWKDKLTYLKEGDKDELTLQGNAVFLDPDHDQELRGDVLKVLMSPPEKGKNEKAGKSPEHPTPIQVTATGNVSAKSPDMNMVAQQRLTLLFNDVPPGTLPPPSQVGGKAAPAVKQGELGFDQPAPVSAARNGQGAGPNAPKKSRPIDLNANVVVAHILREGSRHELQQVYCDGKVVVLQAPEKPGDNGVDIRGDTLDLNHRPEGDILTVTGNHAQVQMDQLFILGPEIHMDQARNEVDVRGMGVMRMLSRQSFDGKELAKPTELRIDWQGRMFFDGTQASFFKKVRAAQDAGQMKCEELVVTLDKHLSLKEGARGEQPAVEKLVCTTEVAVEDVKRLGNKVVEFKRISAQQLSMDNDRATKERSINASGNGSVRMFQLASKQDSFEGLAEKTPAKQAPGKTTANKGAADDKEFKLTMIWYEGKMWANNSLGIAKFYDHVYLIQLPTEDHEYIIPNGNLPRGAMTLVCERMEVQEKKHADNTTSQELRAHVNVRVTGQNYEATCDVLKYDTSKEQIILEMTNPGDYVRLYRSKFPGGPRDKTEARKIIYNRATGEFEAAGMRSSSITP